MLFFILPALVQGRPGARQGGIVRHYARFAVETPSLPCVLIVASPPRANDLSSALVELKGAIDLVSTSGTDHALEIFRARRPRVVVLTSALEGGDAKSLMAALGSIVPRSKVGFVLIGDDTGPVRTAVDAIDYSPDRFVPWPVVPSALRVAVRSALETVSRRARAGTTPGELYGDPAVAKVAQRARWEALADIIVEPADAAPAPGESDDEPSRLPPLFEIRPRRDHEPIATIESWGREASAPSEVDESVRDAELNDNAELHPPRVRATTNPPPIPAIRSRALSDAPPRARQTHRVGEDDWSEPTPLSEVGERLDSGLFVDDALGGGPLDDVDLESPAVQAAPADDGGEVEDPDLLVPTPLASSAHDDRGSGQDFARQLRAKMSLMAKRLFHGAGEAAEPVEVPAARLAATEVDLAALGGEPSADPGGVTTIERTSGERRDRPSAPHAVGSWTTQVRERGLPDAGELVRGVSDAATVLAALFTRGTTGRASFRQDDIEKVVYLDAGRPVFASSNAPGDRMGELLVREGKITAAQYDRCQADVLATGRRIGEILVDFGYLKRRELLPAVRRHVEDIVFSLFGWTRGSYQVTHDAAASSERIRMSRHPASLVLEGIRRKLDRATLERLVGPSSTVIDLAAHFRGAASHSGRTGTSDSGRDKLGSILNASDLTDEERAALAAFDGRNDVAAVARVAGVDLADVLPLAWGLCVLGLATARRPDADETSAVLVGESDLAIDRERIRSRWQLVGEADYFALLGVRRDATAFEIRRAYQLACRDFAADAFPIDLRREFSRELAEIATVLDEAYRVMRDDELRVLYLSHLPEPSAAHLG